jgi:hypothetical protein
MWNSTSWCALLLTHMSIARRSCLKAMLRRATLELLYFMIPLLNLFFRRISARNRCRPLLPAHCQR